MTRTFPGVATFDFANAEFVEIIVEKGKLWINDEKRCLIRGWDIGSITVKDRRVPEVLAQKADPL